jgi:hypothetical protein
MDLLEDPDGAPYPEAVQDYVRRHLPPRAVISAAYEDEVRAALVAAIQSVLESTADRLDAHAATCGAHIHGDDDTETAMASATYAHAARIVRGQDQ